MMAMVGRSLGLGEAIKAVSVGWLIGVKSKERSMCVCYCSERERKA